MEDLTKQQFDRICIIKPSSLGDIIHTLPVLNGLRQRYPQSRISWVLNTEYAELLSGHPQLDEVIPFDRHKFKSLWGAFHMTFRLQGFAAQLRQRQFDLVVDLAGLFRSGLMTWGTGAAVRVGFDPAREGAGMFYNHRVEVLDATLHAVDKNYLFAKVLGFEDVPIDFQLPVDDGARAAIRETLTSCGLSKDRPFVLVLPGSRWETKNWWPQRYSATIDDIQERLGWGVVISGSPSEQNLSELIAQTCRSRPVELASKTRLPELTALIAESSVVLCNDSAPLHIAVALKKPLVTLFGPTSPQRTGPYGQFGNVLQADLPCSPCFLRQLRKCPNNHECMKLITPQQVVGAIAAQIGTNAATTAAR